MLRAIFQPTKGAETAKGMKQVVVLRKGGQDEGMGPELARHQSGKRLTADCHG